MGKRYSIGVDIGGSHITSAVINLEERIILRETVTEMPVDNMAEGDVIISQWGKAIGKTVELVPEGDFKGVGFAMPGPFDYVNGICLIKGVPKYQKLYGTNVGDAMRKELALGQDISFRFMNDASSFAVGEAWAGEAAGTSRSMAITLGTGLGSAFISDSIPVVTGDSVPDLGCVYHIKVGDGIADDYFSTRWFTGRYKEITGLEAKGVKEIAEAAGSQPDISSLFTEFGLSLGELLAPWLKRFKAEILVIGGNISRAYNLFGQPLNEELRKRGCNTVISVSKLKEDAALLGSAYLLDDLFWDSVKDSLEYM